MYWIENIKFLTLKEFQETLNDLKCFEVVQILKYKENGFDKAGEATVLFKQRN